MQFNKDNKGRLEEFDEFFGKGVSPASVHEGYDANDDVFAAKARRRSRPPRFEAHSRSGSSPSPAAARPSSPPSRSDTALAAPGRFVPHSGGAARSSPAQKEVRGRFHRRNEPLAELSAEAPAAAADKGAAGGEPLWQFEGEQKPPKKREPKRTLGIAALVLLAVIVIAAGVFFLRPQDGGEYFRLNGTLPQPGNIRQTAAYDRSVWLSWDAVDSVCGYRIYRKDALTGEYSLLKTAYLPFAVITGLESGSGYDLSIRPFCRTDGGEYTAPVAEPFIAKTLPGDAYDAGQSDSTESTVTVSWPAVRGADGYEVHKYTGSWWSYELCGSTAEVQATVTGLKSAEVYTVKVRPYIESGGERWYGGWSDTFKCATSPVAVSGVSQGDTTESGYRLSWSPCPNATGYEVYTVKDDAEASLELITQCGGTSFDVSGLDSVTFRTYRVRAFLRYENGVSFGEYSEPLATVTLPGTVVGLDQHTAKNGEYTLSWQPTERAAGYQLEAYRCSTGEYELVGEVTEPKWLLTDIRQYAENYRVRALVELSGLTFYGEYSEAMPCYPYVNLKRRVTVNTGHTALRNGAGPEFEQLGELPRYTKARVFSEKSGTDGERWFRVELADGRTGWIERADVSITNDCATLTARTYTKESPVVIYLSPSRQDNNPYCIGDTNEREQMEAVAKELYDILAAEYSCVVYVATPELSLRERAFEALELGSDVYLAIHSNATGNSDVRYGASSYYCGASGRSKSFGQNVVKELNRIAPARCNLEKQMYSALESFGRVGYAEVRDPYNLGMVPLLAETDFHDNELTARWIMENHELIARAYADALASTFDIEKKA